MPRRSLIALVAIIAVGGVVAWRAWYPRDERDIRKALASLVAQFNSSPSEGLGAIAHAAEFASYFTERVVIDLGPGTAKIEGRETVMGMAARLQPRTAGYRVELADIGVSPSAEPGAKDVTLTVTFIRREGSDPDGAIDAREFLLTMIKEAGRWRIAHATAVDTLR